MFWFFFYHPLREPASAGAACLKTPLVSLNNLSVWNKNRILSHQWWLVVMNGAMFVVICWTREFPRKRWLSGRHQSLTGALGIAPSPKARRHMQWLVPLLLPLCAQREVLQAGRPHAHVGEALARVGPGHPAPHRGPHLHALGRQWEEGSVGVRGEGRQRLSQRSSQGVSWSRSEHVPLQIQFQIIILHPRL